jgi:hypothetical protein
MRTLIFLAAAVLVGVWTAADLLLRALSALLRTCRRLADARYARKWGVPPEVSSEETQRRVAAELRCDAILRYLTEQEWADFVEAHQESTGSTS